MQSIYNKISLWQRDVHSLLEFVPTELNCIIQNKAKAIACCILQNKNKTKLAGHVTYTERIPKTYSWSSTDYQKLHRI